MNKTQDLTKTILLLAIGCLIGLGAAILTRDGHDPMGSLVLQDDRGRPIYPYQEREVQNTVSRHHGPLRDIYIGYLAGNPEVRQGNMHFQWYISANGKASQAEFVYGALNDPELIQQVASQIEDWDFPPPGCRTYVEYTFQFEDINMVETEE